MAKRRGLEKVYIHAFLDGRDVSPTSGKDFVAEAVEKCAEIGVGKVATVGVAALPSDSLRRPKPSMIINVVGVLFMRNDHS